MLSSHGLQSALSPSMDFYWPLPSLFYQQDLLHTNLQDLLHTNRQDLISNVELMDELQHDLLEETDPFQSSVAELPVSHRLDGEGRSSAGTLDAPGFSPEELSVRQEGRKLRVSRKTEEKQEDGNISHTLQEFTEELDVPEGLNPEGCCLSPDRKIHIQPASHPCAEEERETSIKRSLEEETQQSVSSQQEHKETNNNTQDRPADMD